MSAYTASRSPAAYKQQSILTAPRGQLVVMLYDGCVRFLGQAAQAMRAERPGEAGERLSRAEAIVDELLSTLDLEQGGVIASRLQGIYVWSTQTLIKARLDQDAEAIETVAELFGELRESWAQIAAA
ncbi:MAG TPA: flagellar export chaperone FliS [Solirubrobacteraceae bacterium]|nr:flagellar export chaperone FliS [Solirubrobacteraceae bacterium]